MDRKHDAAFHVIFPEALPTGKSSSITVAYEGDKVVRKEGGGNFSVVSRESWYPNVNAFLDRARFDLTFHYPKRYTLIAVGKLDKESRDGGQNVSHWVSEVPLPVAGFNFGEYKKKEVDDESTKYSIEGYATLEVPDFLKPHSAVDSGPDMNQAHVSTGLRDQLLVPSALNEQAIVEARAAVQVYTHYFGPLPYGRIAITQQPAMYWGQSWPTLVYLPIIAYLDPTQRLHLYGTIERHLNEFVDEVTPHEVSHQWWGHMVGWKSFHDQWLSEGFADFSAALFFQATQKTPEKYLTFWLHARERILEKNEFGNSANDAGPIWMGRLLSSAHNEGAYQAVVYSKGGYVLHMLRSMMWDARNGDAAFIQMMHDFVETYHNRSATTEDFQQIVEKHMVPAMNVDGNGKMDWFFNEWVYGREIPSYSLDYNLTPGADGKTVLKLKVTQAGVGPTFKMPVEVYVNYDGKIVRLGQIRVTGSSTSPEATVNLARKPDGVVLNANYDVLSYK
jgi:aminopeptidase N